MAAELTFLQSPVLTKFVYPFLLVFFILFAILEKSKLFGEGKQQINALIAFVISFIFISAVFPKEMVSNLMLFMVLAIVIVFVVLMLWGFIMGDAGVKVYDNSSKGLKWAIGIVIIIAVVIAVLWAAGVDLANIRDRLFDANWSDSVWSTLVFVVVVAAALAFGLKTAKKN